MSKHKFQLSITQWQEIHALPDCWPLGKLREVLALLEFDDPTADDEVPDVVNMLLEDMGPRLATEVVLEAVFDKQMSPGVRQNIAEDLQEDEPWSQHAVVAQQSGIFTAVVLLHRAMPKYFGRPDAISFDLKLQTSAPEAKAWLTDQIDPALLVRLLAQGMAPQTTLNRLYEDELAGDSFPSAKDILWQVRKVGADHYSVISSGHWVGTLEDCADWSASAAVDKPVKR